MSAILTSIIIYALLANIIGGGIYSFGRKRGGPSLELAEYPLIYLPWLTLIAMTFIFFGSVDHIDNSSGLWTYFWILQNVTAGVLGGFVLLPRFLVKAETFGAKLLVTLIAGVVFSAVFGMTRFFLFALSSASGG